MWELSSTEDSTGKYTRTVLKPFHNSSRTLLKQFYNFKWYSLSTCQGGKINRPCHPVGDADDCLFNLSVMSTKFWKSVCPTLFKYHGDIAKTGDKSSLLCHVYFNTKNTDFKSSKWKLLYKQFVWATLVRGDWVDDRSPSKTWWYLCQPVLSSEDDSSHMICNVPLCALKIKIYCVFFCLF